MKMDGFFERYIFPRGNTHETNKCGFFKSTPGWLYVGIRWNMAFTNDGNNTKAPAIPLGDLFLQHPSHHGPRNSILVMLPINFSDLLGLGDQKPFFQHF